MKKRDIMKINKGFTLIELMIVVAIIGIISALALSSYNASVRKARRSDAMNSLTKTAVDLERCYTANGQYTTTTPEKTCSVVDSSNKLTSTPIDYTVSTKGYYNISILNTGTDLTATTFLLTAQPATTDQQKDTQCAKFTISNQGIKQSYDTSGNDTTTTAYCWGR